MSRSHGMSSMPEYGIWAGMKARCYNERHGKFKYYGGRGIGVCARWRNDFPAFLEDVGPRPSPAHSLGRLDNDGNYEPGNVEWQTMTTQQRNTGVTRFYVHHGERKSTTEWAEIIGVSETTIRRRIAKGVPIDQADVPAMRAAEDRIAHLEAELARVRARAKRWKACAKKWRSIVNQVDAECAQAYEAELSAKKRASSMLQTLETHREFCCGSGHQPGYCSLCDLHREAALVPGDANGGA